MKRCTLGLKCPHIGQRQHNQEYYHKPESPSGSRTSVQPAQPAQPAQRPIRTAKIEANKRIEHIQSGKDVVKAVDPPPLKVKAVKKLRTAPPSRPVEEAEEPTRIIDDQELEYINTLHADRKKQEEIEKALLSESLRLEAEREARQIAELLRISQEDERQKLKQQFADTEPLTSPFVIQFRCPNGILKRHFAPTDRWNVEVLNYLKCHIDPNQHWTLFDPVNTSSPVIDSKNPAANNYTIADYSQTGKRFSFIVNFHDEDED